MWRKRGRADQDEAMELTFLGTAAANAYPEPFCRCARCEQARALGGPSLRKRSAALINDDLLIDLGPDVLTACAQHGRELTNLRYCLQTHAHHDHLDVSHFFSRSPGYDVVGAPRLHFYASAGSLQRAADALVHDFGPGGLLTPEVGDQLNVTFHTVAAGEAFDMGAYRVLVFAADHDPAVEPLLYAVQGEGRTLFYGTDTAALPEATWQNFRRHGLKFDLFILDHTYGLSEPKPLHTSAREFVAQLARLREEDLLAPGARVLATHIAHPGNPVHPELVEFAAPYGYEIAYDGLTVSVGGNRE
jgi:phosphoribosyl 1,2-cyclic phosphate phosphodiesterase